MSETIPARKTMALLEQVIDRSIDLLYVIAHHLNCFLNWSTGTTSTCVSHIITSVIGSGILSLAWSTAQLGWIGGPVCMILLAIVTYVSVFLLSNVYRTPDSIHGGRNKSYIEAVKNSLGTNQTWVCGLLQYVNLYGTGVAYTITASISLRWTFCDLLRPIFNCAHLFINSFGFSQGDPESKLLSPERKWSSLWIQR